MRGAWPRARAAPAVIDAAVALALVLPPGKPLRRLEVVAAATAWWSHQRARCRQRAARARRPWARWSCRRGWPRTPSTTWTGPTAVCRTSREARVLKRDDKGLLIQPASGAAARASDRDYTIRFFDQSWLPPTA